MNEEKINNAILTLETLIDCCKEDGTYYNAQKEWEALEVFKQLQNNWNELKNRTQKKIEQLEHFNEQLKTSPYTPQIETLKLTLKDMQELENK